VLHLVNGEATLPGLRAAGVPGTLRVWDDILVEGPVRPGPAGPAAWRERGQVLARRLGIPADEYVRRVAASHRALAGAAGEDEVVLWFEEDLFCQLHLADLLGRVPAGPAPRRLSLVCPAEPLGARDGPALRALFEARGPVAPERAALARRLLATYGSDDPAALAALAAGELPAWPALAGGLRAHLARFPAVGDGLAGAERAALQALAAGPRPFGELFRAARREPAVAALGYTDLQLLADLAELGTGPVPLVRAPALPGGEAWHPRARGGPAWPTLLLDLTDAGRAVLAGRADRAALVPLDRWLGGVHLAGPAPAWRWDPAAGALRPGSSRARPGRLP
jgi:hypothetical protein